MGLNELYKEYSKLVYNLALQYVQNIEDAEEITQDVFVAVHQNFSGFKADADIGTWIYRIAINKSLDFIKAKQRKKRFAFLTSILLPDSNQERRDLVNFNHPGVQLEHKEALTAIFNQINNLPEKQKTAIILHRIERLSQREVAEIMQISEKAVESLVQRAKVSLKNKLTPTKDNNNKIV